MTKIKEITVPDIGQFSGVEIIEISITPGALVKVEESLITLETEKASMDVPSPVNGKIQEVKVKVGDKVSQGDLIALVEVEESLSQSEPHQLPAKEEKKTEEKAQKEPKKEIKKEVEREIKSESNGVIHAGPATRRLARELGVALHQVKGSGRKDRITTQDIHAYVKAILQNNAQSSREEEAVPEIDFTQFGEIEVKPLSRIKKWTAKNLHRNWITIPHVTQFDEADITALEEFRQESKQIAEQGGVKLTPLSFIVKAVTSALKAFPQFNASLASNGADLIFKKYFHIGIAVDTPQGLMVPVIKQVDSKGLFELAREMSELSALAKEGKLKTEQMSGNTFSISSLGGVGGTAFTPIINAPDVAILGVSKMQIKPVYINNELVPRKILPLSLSYDHRVIDGAEAAKFVAHIAMQLQDIRKLLL